jgi:uncharacterized protein
MSRLYGEQHRALQAEFGTTQLADRVEDIACKTEFDDEAKGFIEHLDMFFLSSVDHQGRPTVSYKGGDAGFVKILDANTLMFPSYDGNGMFFSIGNISINPQVGLLFISFEKPHRIRVQGTATLSREPALLSQYKEAEFVVLVTLSELWQNCPRYIHQMEKVRESRYVPRETCETPVAEWKRIDLMQDVILEKDKAKVETIGTIDIDTWVEKIKTGHPEA